jgi:molybdopterin-containing oxidoreductase family iron-sulfur binding subunit
MAEVSRRVVLQLLGSGAAITGAEACSRGPAEAIVPYVNQPPEVHPSVPTRYATTMMLGGTGIGVIAESHEGRPTKLEGNPEHPASLGALGTLEQASLFDLYDPSRASTITHQGLPATWHALASAIATTAPAGQRTYVLLEPTSAPHLARLAARVRARGDVVVLFDAPLARSNVWAGAKLAFGRVVEPRYDFGQADLVLSLDSDFLAATAMPMVLSRAWADKRKMAGPHAVMSRLYVVEPRLTVTGMSADERLPVQARQVASVAADLVARLDASRGAVRGESAWSEWTRAAAQDLKDHAGASLVVAGDAQPPEVHALAHAINELLGNVGRTVTYGPSPVFEAAEGSPALEALVRAIDAREVATLVIVGGDPAYTAAADLDLERRIRSVPLTAYVGTRQSETARACTWFAPEAHFLESWGDARAFDGTASIAQPLIRPLAEEARTPAQVLAAMVGRPDATSRELVEEHWQTSFGEADFAILWRRALVHGVLPGGGTPTVDLRVDWPSVARAMAMPTSPQAPLEIVYYADAKVYDGRFSENAWLQELADPVTKLTWDNAALVAEATAERWGAKTSDVVELTTRGRSLRAPVLVVPGMAEGVVAMALGYGKSIPVACRTGSAPTPIGCGTRARRGRTTSRHARSMAPGSWRERRSTRRWRGARSSSRARSRSSAATPLSRGLETHRPRRSTRSSPTANTSGG